jgi:uncharacterized repeat protein (TIGR03803 family)
VLHTFTDNPDGATPSGDVILDADGNFFGTSANGGTEECAAAHHEVVGCGTVFKVDTSGNETVLYSFNPFPPDGKFPLGGVVRDAGGNLYGTTPRGGKFHGGIVFRIDTSGNGTVLYNFAKARKGYYPVSGLILDSAGNLYGTTLYGGTGNCKSGQQDHGCGTVFKLSKNGKETVLHNFTRRKYGADFPLVEGCSWTKRAASTASRKAGPPPME